MVRWVNGEWRDDPADDPEPQCPECGERSFIYLPRLVMFVAATIVLVPAGILFDEPELFGLTLVIVAALLLLVPNVRCTECGERWHGTRPRPADIPTEVPDVHCPQCNSPETQPISRRRMKAATLLVNFVVPPLLFVWPFLPRRRCEHCDHEWR